MLDFEGAGIANFRRRFLQTFRPALGTGAKLSQIIKGVNPGVVAIAPLKLKGIIPYRDHIHAFQA